MEYLPATIPLALLTAAAGARVVATDLHFGAVRVTENALPRDFRAQRVSRPAVVVPARHRIVEGRKAADRPPGVLAQG